MSTPSKIGAQALGVGSPTENDKAGGQVGFIEGQRQGNRSDFAAASPAPQSPPPNPAGKAFIVTLKDDDSRRAWDQRAESAVGISPRIKRGKPTRCVCAACRCAGVWRHSVSLMHLMPVPALAEPVVSIFEGKVCGRCAGRLRAGDAVLIESLKASRRPGVRERVLGALLEVMPTGGDLYLHQQGINTTTPAGKALFQMMGVFAEFEREIIRERVAAGLARARVHGTKSGNPIGRPTVGDKVEERIRELRAQGHGMLMIAKQAGCGVSVVQRVLAAA